MCMNSIKLFKACKVYSRLKLFAFLDCTTAQNQTGETTTFSV